MLREITPLGQIKVGAPANPLNYTEFTATVNGTQTTEATAGTIVTASPLVFDGLTPIEIEFFVPAFYPGAIAGQEAVLVLYDGAVSIGLMTVHRAAAAATAERIGITAKRRLTPSAGSHTYSIRAYGGANGWTADAGAGVLGALVPGFLKISSSTAGVATTLVQTQELSYNQIAADVAGINATTEATAVAIINGSSFTADGTKVKIEFFCPGLLAAAALDMTFVVLRDGVPIGQFQARPQFAGPNFPVNATVYDTPSAASHAYAVKAFVSASNATVKAGTGAAGTLLPAFLRVTKA